MSARGGRLVFFAAVAFAASLLVASVTGCEAPNVSDCIEIYAEEPFDECVDRVHFCVLSTEEMSGDAKVAGAANCMVLKARCDQAMLDEIVECLEWAEEEVER